MPIFELPPKFQCVVLKNLLQFVSSKATIKLTREWKEKQQKEQILKLSGVVRLLKPGMSY